MHTGFTSFGPQIFEALESFFVLKVAARVHLASSDGNDLSGERLMAHNLFSQPETITVCYFLSLYREGVWDVWHSIWLPRRQEHGIKIRNPVNYKNCAFK